MSESSLSLTGSYDETSKPRRRRSPTDMSPSSQLDESYTDENGIVWAWDGEDYVVNGDDGLKWIFDGEEWAVKGDDGRKWIFDGVNWCAKGDDGQLYIQDAMGNFVLKSANQVETPSPTNAGDGTKTSAKISTRKKKRKHCHHKPRRRHPESINISAILPSRTNQGASANNRSYQPTTLEVARYPSLPAHCHHCPPTPQHTHLSPSCTIHSNKGSKPHSFSTCENCARCPVHSTSNKVPPDTPKTNRFGFGRLLEAIGMKPIVRPTNNQEYKKVSVHEGPNLEWRSVNLTGNLAMAKASDKSSTPDKLKAIQPGILSPAITSSTDTGLGPNREEGYRNVVEALTNENKNLGSRETRQRQLQHLAGIIQNLSKEGYQAPADQLILTLAKTMMNLLEESLKASGRGSDRTFAGQSRFWDPRVASQLDALVIRSGQHISEAHEVISSVHSGLESVIKQYLSVCALPERRSPLRTNEDRHEFEKLIEGHLEDIFDQRKVFERLQSEIDTVQEKAEQFSISDPKCACRPQRELLLEDQRFLHERLCESNDKVEMLREKLLVAEIRGMHYKKRTEYYQAQIQVLAGRTGDTISAAVLEDSKQVQKDTAECETRLKLLEQKLDAFTDKKLADGRSSLVSKLLASAQEEKSKSNLDQHRSGMTSVVQTPLRVMNIPEPVNMAAVKINLGGNTSENLIQLSESLTNAREKVSGTSTQTDIDNCIDQIRQVIRHVEQGTDNEESATFARQLSQNITKLAYRDIPHYLTNPKDVDTIRSVQDFASRAHNLAEEIRQNRPRGHLPFQEGYRAAK